nr:MAG TPA: hypothetical protein [Caudoviricetes sp.]
MMVKKINLILNKGVKYHHEIQNESDHAFIDLDIIRLIFDSIIHIQADF